LTSRRGSIVLLGLCWFAHLLANTDFILRDQASPQGLDAINHVSRILQITLGLDRVGLPVLLEEMPGPFIQWPPLVHLLNSLLAYGVDASMPALRLYNLIFLAVLLAGVFWIGVQCHSTQAGLLAALCCSFIPAIYGPSRQLTLDFSCAAMVVVGIGALLATREFSKLGTTLLCGALAGLAVMTRIQSGFFLLAPALWILGRRVLRKDSLAMRNALFCLLIALVICIPYIYGDMSRFPESTSAHFDPAAMPDEIDPRSWDPSWRGGVDLYLGDFPTLFSMPLLAMLLFFIPHGLGRPSRGRRELLLWLIAPWVLYTFILWPFRNIRYLLPLVPVLPLIASIGVLSLPRPWMRRLGSALLLAAAIIPWALCDRLCSRDDLSPRSSLCRSSLLCGNKKLNHSARKDATLCAARQVAGSLQSLHPGGDWILIMADLGANASANMVMNNVIRYVQSLLPRVVYWSGESPPTWLVQFHRQTSTRYLLTINSRKPNDQAATLVDQRRVYILVDEVDTSALKGQWHRHPRGEEITGCLRPTKKAHYGWVMVSLWRMKPDSRGLPQYKAAGNPITDPIPPPPLPGE